jgi:putative restriction endonuclease
MALSSVEQSLLRLDAFAELELLIDARGGFATYRELLDFEVRGRRFPLIDLNRGIRNPAEFDATLSVVSAVDGPYDDDIGPDGIMRYAFRAGDPAGSDNRKLRKAMETRTPIILFEKPMPNIYVPIMPAFVIDEDVAARFFLIATDEAVWRAHESGDAGIDKRYVAQIVERRVHQPVFRARVIIAYNRTCAVCRLAHPELLDAAHIIADSDAAGVAHVTNGLALCKIHHAAYDNNLIGISPDFIVEVDRDLLLEVDGPMLKHGIQEMHGNRLTLPARRADWPSRESLDARFATFRS